MKKLLFGTAGIPLSTRRPATTESGIARVKELGLEAMELEFVRSINISREKAPVVRAAAKSADVVLTCHAPYFINLNAVEKPKVYASINRILQSARITHLCGGYSLCFHAGFYLKMEPEKVYVAIRDRIREIQKALADEGVNIWIRPETTGKASQFGDLDELLKISSEVEKVMPVIDFAHLHARNGGGNNSFEDFRDMLSKVEKFLGKDGLQNMHIHVSGINYSEKGERNHLFLEESDMNYKGLMRALKEFRAAGVVICESPNIETDALLMKNYYERLS